MGNYWSSEIKYKHKFPVRPDIYDKRDFIHKFPTTTCFRLRFTESSSLRDKFPPVFDQGKLGSCTANAAAGALQYDNVVEGLNEDDAAEPSRLYIYYNGSPFRH